MVLKEYANIEELSDVLGDPLQISRLLLRIKFEVANKRAPFNEALSELERTAKSSIKDYQAVYFLLRHEERNRNIRGVLVGDYVIALTVEEGGVIRLKGKAAFSEVATSYKASNPVIKVSYARITPDVAKDTPIENYLREIISRVSEEKPPNIWVGRLLYDYKVVEAVSDKGGFTYVLKTVGKDGLTYVFKIPRDKLPNGTLLALSGPEKISDFMRSYINVLQICHPDKEEIVRFLAKVGLGEALYKELSLYKKYVLCPYGFILTQETYDTDSYIDNPPVVIEPYADLGDLHDYVSRRGADAKFVASVGLRVAGALALAHALSILHLDVKPHNILLRSDPKEPYGVRPYISDFASTGRAVEGWYKPTRLTPEFADPLSLLEMRAGFDYDVYSLGLTLLTALTSKKLPHRTLVNLLALKYVYGMDISVEPFLLDYPALATFHKEVEPLFKSLAEGRARVGEIVERVIPLVVDRDKISMDVLSREVDKDLFALLSRTITLKREDRFRNSLEFWLSFKKLLQDKKWEDAIPKPP
ncbi:protein kinase domain-containing protein [Thermogladius sp.]|uniref:protein kinase domain-containing protein n=1 Tax=Thermogladius sp. TaxID=2023064 RepID=UPI003D096C8D